MSSKIQLFYQHRVTGQEISLRRVDTGLYINNETGEKVFAHQLRSDYKLLKQKSQIVNKTFTQTPRPPMNMPRDYLKSFRIKRCSEYKICDTGKGPSYTRPWEVWWGDEMVEGDFPTQNHALMFIREKVNS
jgi:hypothetical protein